MAKTDRPERRAMNAIFLSVFAGSLWPSLVVPARSAPPPNVIIVITDDQGYGELSAHGNPILRTPCLDRLRSESVRFSDFHAAPMCTPTRGQLMTGVDALRNGAMNVSSGRALLRREFPTMAEMFAAAGYRTGLFGKWHLGDSHPYRPQDRGFHESLWFPSSHIGSVPDAWENDYFDDTYIHNGRRRAFDGYTTDVFFREVMAWMAAEDAAGRRFFCYLSTAAPHWPFFVPDRYRAPVRAALDAAGPSLPPLPPAARADLVSYLAMIANIDENMGRLDAFLADRGLRDNTLLIFLTDNGSTFGSRYFNAGMRGHKATLWEGGHRVPCFVRWPAGGLRAPSDVAGLTQVQDLLPTLIDLCGLTRPAGAVFDGISLTAVLRGEEEPPLDRMLVVNYSRMPHGVARASAGNNPATPRREGAAVLWRRWRLLEDRELFDLESDPLQKTNVIALHPSVAERMRAHLDRWWAGVKDRANDFEAVSVGHEAENPVRLTACEWADVFLDQQVQVRRGERKNGVWHINVSRSGEYQVTLRRWPRESALCLTDGAAETRVTDGTLPGGDAWPVAATRLLVGDADLTQPVPPGAGGVIFAVWLPDGRTTMQTWFLDAGGTEIAGAYYAEARRLSADREPAPSWGRPDIILDTDMSGDADDAGALALLHALADMGECRILATVVNRKDLSNASAAAVDAINTWYGRPDLPIGTDKAGPTALRRDSPYAPGLRDGFPNDIGPDDAAPDAADVYRSVLTERPDGSVTICSIGALSNLAELWRQAPDLVRRKVRRLVIMGGKFQPADRPETNIATHPDAARLVAAEWPGEVFWLPFEVGHPVITGAGLRDTPAANPVRRAYELRRYQGRPSINGGQPSYDQAAALFAVRGPDPRLWTLDAGGKVCIVDPEGTTRWTPGGGRHTLVQRAADTSELAGLIEALMIHPPRGGRTAAAARG